MHVANKKKSKRKLFYIKRTDIKELKAIQALKTVIKFFCLFSGTYRCFFIRSHEPEEWPI